MPTREMHTRMSAQRCSRLKFLCQQAQPTQQAATAPKYRLPLKPRASSIITLPLAGSCTCSCRATL